jgi:SAM-dependent methyltransferase
MLTPGFEDRRLSFGSNASTYAARRPGYPTYSLVWALAGAEHPVRDVVDVGAGTGALTSTLVDLGLDVTACEPDAGMLGELSRRLPTVEAIQGQAEALPLPDASVDAVVAAQAWHWFDRVGSATEFTRVLRPGGVLVLLWNVRDDRVPWMAALSDLIDGEDSMRASRTDAWADIAAVHPGVARADVPHRVTSTPEQVVELVSTFSYVRLRPDADRVYDEVRELLATHPDTRGKQLVEVPYVTATYRWRRD